MSLEAASRILSLRLPVSDLSRMHQLAVKNQSGLLDPQELMELENYRAVAYDLDILRAKATLRLNESASSINGSNE